MQYLEFEKPIEELVKKLNQAKDLGEDQSVDVTKTIFDLESKIKLTRKNIYENLTSWQRVQLSRHPQRPYALDFTTAITGRSSICCRINLRLFLRMPRSTSIIEGLIKKNKN